MTLKHRIFRSLTRLFIILVSLLTRSLFSEKMLISDKCIGGLMPNLIKESWRVSNREGAEREKRKKKNRKPLLLSSPVYVYVTRAASVVSTGSLSTSKSTLKITPNTELGQNGGSTLGFVWSLWSGQINHCGANQKGISQCFCPLCLTHNSKPAGRGEGWCQLFLHRQRNHEKLH